MITKEDVQSVAYDLKMDASDVIIQEVLNSYEDFAKQCPCDNWSEIVEIMLYDRYKECS